MRLLVGLGNPDAQYKYNRHNIGFMAIDAIAEHHGLTSSWRSAMRGDGAVAKGIIDSEEVLLLKPLTYMNASGDVVQQTCSFLKVNIDDVVVFHDEIELPPAKLKTRVGGGSRGHNGLRSISARIGNDYRRVCIGVGRPELRRGVDAYVLSDFRSDERLWVQTMLDTIAANVKLIATHQDLLFQDQVNFAMMRRGFDDNWRKSIIAMNRTV